MKLAAIGWVLALLSVIFRSICLRERNFPLGCKFATCFCLWTLGNALAFFGLSSLASGPATPKVEYSSVLGVLSLLSAGAFAGFCAVEYERARENESGLLNFLSVLFMTLFYLLFSAICYYIGKSENMHQVEAVSYVIPIIMAILLEVNTVIDIWDYRKPADG